MPYSPDWEKSFDERFGEYPQLRFKQNGNTVETVEIASWGDVKSFIRSLLQAREEWLRGEIEKLETPEDHVACDYAEHVDKNDVLAFLTPKN